MSKFPYDLTISMIVKNEKNYLRRCLETLQPLRQAISCQLIITDTGSTDGTIEIAKEFADVYLEFDWCQDFAKARNFGIEKAEGRWLFYIDADHEFDESLLAVAQFLNTPNVDRDVDAASVHIRNYNNKEKTKYNDCIRSLLVNFTQGKRFFKGAIHESIGVNQNKVQVLGTLLHHWGYLAQSIDQKNERNLPILRQVFEENPADLKNRVQLAKELSDPEEKRAFFDESIVYMSGLAKKSDDAKMWLMVLRNHYHLFALHVKDYVLAERLIGEWTTYLAGSLFEINFLGFCMEVYLQQKSKRQELLFQTFPKYQALFTKKRHPSDAGFQMFDDFRFATDFHYYQVEFRSIHQAIEAERMSEASLWTTSSKAHQFTLPDQKHKYLFDVTHLCFKLGEYDFLSTVYTYAVQHSPPQELELLLQDVEKQYLALPSEEKKVFLSVLPNQCIHWYLALLKLRYYQNKLTLCPKEVKEQLKNTPKLDTRPILAPLLHSFLLTGEDPISYLDHVSLPHLDALEQRLLATQADWEEGLTARLDALTGQEDIKGLPLVQKQVLGHLALSQALRLHEKGTSSEKVLSLFWTAVCLLVHTVAERGGFATSAPHQSKEQVAVLLWQGQRDLTTFQQAKEQAIPLCPSLSPLIALLAQTPPATKEEMAQKKGQIKETILALEKANRPQEARQLRTAFLTSHPEEWVGWEGGLQAEASPLLSLKEALSHSLSLLDTPSAQAKQQLFKQQYQSLLS